MSTKMRYEAAKEIYAEYGIDTDAAIKLVSQIPVSMHCWQGDDVHGFENPDGDLTGGIQVTGNYPGKATNIAQLRADFDKATSLIPGKKRINLHSFYLDNGGEALRFLDRMGKGKRPWYRLQPLLFFTSYERRRSDHQPSRQGSS